MSTRRSTRQKKIRLFVRPFLCALILFGSFVPGAATQAFAEEEFGFGVGYIMQGGRAGVMKEIGVDWAKQGSALWKVMEPWRPFGKRHFYNWKLADEKVREWTDAGFNMMIELWSKSNWATTQAKQWSVAIISSPPKPEHWGDYAAWVAEVVERYDGDGYKDMPGLKKPVLYYEIESESQHHAQWAGTAEEYIRLLSSAYQAAKQAHPEVKIILTGIAFIDLFDDFPSEETVEKRMRLNKEFVSNFEFVKKVLGATGAYDLIEFHYNRGYTGVYDTVRWIRKYSSKPIWAGDAVMGPWIKPDMTFFAPLFTQAKGTQLVQAIANPKNPRHKEILAWQQKEQAGWLVKKVVCAIDAGLQGINIDNIDDWKGAYAVALGNYKFMGLLDEAGKPKPAYYSYQLLLKKIKGFTSAERLDLSGDVLQKKGKGIWAFRFTVGGKKVYVLWYEDAVSECPVCPVQEGAPVSIDLTSYLPEGSEQVKITHTITQSGQRQPKEEYSSAGRISVNGSPIFVEISQ